MTLDLFTQCGPPEVRRLEERRQEVKRLIERLEPKVLELARRREFFCASDVIALAISDWCILTPHTLPLTPRQAELYRYLWDFTREHLHAPSFKQIAAALNVRSLATPHEHLTSLERKGWIWREGFNNNAIICLVDLREGGA